MGLPDSPYSLSHWWASSQGSDVDSEDHYGSQYVPEPEPWEEEGEEDQGLGSCRAMCPPPKTII